MYFQAAQLASAPFVLPLLFELSDSDPNVLAVILSSLWFFGTLVAYKYPRLNTLFVGVSWAGLIYLLLESEWGQPAIIFPAASLAILHLSALCFPVHSQSIDGRTTLSNIKNAIFVSLVACIVVQLFGFTQKYIVFATSCSSAIVCFLAIFEVFRSHTPSRKDKKFIVGVSIVGLANAFFSLSFALVYSTELPILVLALLLVLSRPSTKERSAFASFARRPEWAIVSLFAIASIVGTFLLSLPLSTSSRNPIGLIDAAFTAVSAVCVTGLIVLDTPIDLSYMGQGVVLVLIQLGGLGIMAATAVATFILGQRLSIGSESVVSGVVAYRHRTEMSDLLRDILVATFVIEFVGALLLAVFFMGSGDSIGMAIWRGIFTSVSAFCNAGFALQSNSLIPYQESFSILSIISVLIILGGISPGFVFASIRLFKGKRANIQIKVVTLVTLSLLIFGTLIIATFEWSNSLAELSPLHKLLNAWFQSVTTRTAGFNSIDFASLKPATIYVMLGLMFVGGSPGGTAGGIKTTTFFILLTAVVGAFRNNGNIVVFGRRIKPITVHKAAAVSMAGILLGFTVLVGLSLTQELDPLVTIFEVVSASATVGLTIGGTEELDGIGKLLVMFCMLAGRLGPTTVFLLLARADRREPWVYPEEDIVVV